MTNFMEESTVLVLNALYQAIGRISPKKALIALNSSPDGVQCAAEAIDVWYPRLEDGSLDLENPNGFASYPFEEWLMVDFREGIDRLVHTSKLQIRCPTVIKTTYSKMPMRRFRATKSVLYEMQKGICGYSGKKMSMKQMNIEHKIPRSQGGKDTFQNLMAVDKDINHKRGNKPLAEVGLTPLFHHSEPRAQPMAYAIKSVIHPDWGYFISK